MIRNRIGGMAHHEGEGDLGAIRFVFRSETIKRREHSGALLIFRRRVAKQPAAGERRPA